MEAFGRETQAFEPERNELAIAGLVVPAVTSGFGP
jgi:hypothetical protein